MFQRILVPLDGSSLAERALPLAARLARATRGSLLLVRVVSPASEFALYSTESSLLIQEAREEDVTRATAYLAQVAQSPDLTDINTRIAVFTGIAASTLLDVVQAQEIDLMVMCSHGETGFRRWALGSVAQKVARHSLVPLLVLSANDASPLRLVAGKTAAVHALVALDGSCEAEAVVEPIAHLVALLSEPFQGVLHLLRVVDLPEHYGGWKSQAHIDTSLIDHVQHDAETYLALMSERLTVTMSNTHPLTITTSVQVHSDVADVILRTAGHRKGGIHQEHAKDTDDLLALATHGRSGIARWALGSVTERVLGATTLPLLIVRSKKA